MTIADSDGERAGARAITSTVVVPSPTVARTEKRPLELTVAGDDATSTVASLGTTVPATVTRLPPIRVDARGEVILRTTLGARIVFVRVCVPAAPQLARTTAALSIPTA